MRARKPVPTKDRSAKRRHPMRSCSRERLAKGLRTPAAQMEAAARDPAVLAVSVEALARAEEGPPRRRSRAKVAWLQPRQVASLAEESAVLPD